jgi:hypothetical protein
VLGKIRRRAAEYVDDPKSANSRRFDTLPSGSGPPHPHDGTMPRNRSASNRSASKPHYILLHNAGSHLILPCLVLLLAVSRCQLRRILEVRRAGVLSLRLQPIIRRRWHT